MSCLRLFLAAVLLSAAAIHPASVEAAESYDNCTGFIDALPATVSTQGTWCLRSNLSTGITNGSAITIAANNVTIECNNFKVGGLAAGVGSLANGIFSENRQNITIRQCNLRGFHIGIQLDGSGGGHLVEDNRLDNNLFTGIYVAGDNNLVQRNRVFDTGGSTTSMSFSVAINASADIIDNTVSGVFSGSEVAMILGIYLQADGAEVRGNLVRGLAHGDGGQAYGVQANAFGATFTANRIIGASGVVGTGIFGSFGSFCVDNIVSHHAPAYDCGVYQDNMESPKF